MTRKDYVLIAQVIATAWHGSQHTKEDLVSRMCDALQGENPAFDRARFVKACGL